MPHPQFKNLKGVLALDGLDKLRKFCGECGLMIQNSTTLLARHLKANHPGEEAGWLKVDS